MKKGYPTALPTYVQPPGADKLRANLSRTVSRERVLKMRNATGRGFPSVPSLPNTEVGDGLVEGLAGTVDSMRISLNDDDLVGVVQDLAMMQYQVLDTAVELGMKDAFHDVFQELHRHYMKEIYATEEEAKVECTRLLDRGVEEHQS